MVLASRYARLETLCQTKICQFQRLRRDATLGQHRWNGSRGFKVLDRPRRTMHKLLPSDLTTSLAAFAVSCSARSSNYAAFYARVRSMLAPWRAARRSANCAAASDACSGGELT